ncbi:universal stress protein [Chloroflexota bacterium]
MYENILVPLDGSNSDDAILPYARDLSKRIGSQITLISVLPPGSQQGKAQYKHLHQFYIQEILKSSEKDNHNINSVISSGDPAEKIVDYSVKKGINLILMGTHGRSSLKRWILGSIADKVISSSMVPVALLTTSEDKNESSLRRNLFRKSIVVLDGLQENEVVVPYAEELASELKMGVTLLQVVGQAYEFYEGAEDYSSVPVSGRKMGAIKAKATKYLARVAGRLEDKGIKTRVEVAVGDSAETVIRIAGEHDADTVFMATRGRSGLSRWFFGGVRGDIVNIGDVLIMLVRIP